MSILTKLRKLLIPFLLLVFLATPAFARQIGFLIEESDGAPADFVYKLKVSNGALTIAGNVATLAVGGSSGGATFTVAASDSDAGNIATADYVCDGTADEVQINAALTALPATGGRVVLFEGGFILADPIVVPKSSCVLEGQGYGTFIDGDGLADNEHGIVIDAMDNVILRNFAIQTEDGGLKTCHCIDISDGADNYLIDNITIIASDSDGIEITGTNMVKGAIRGLSVEQADGYGIYCDPTGGNTMAYLQIRDCAITGCGTGGINLYLADYGLVEDNIVYANTGYGMYIVNTNYINIGNNTAAGNSVQGIFLLNVESSTVQNNLCISNSSNNIDIGNASDHNLIDGNECLSALGVNSDGILVTGAENTISNNVVSTSGMYGISVTGARNKILGNEVTLSGDDGILISGADCQVIGNNIYYNGTDTVGTYHGIEIAGGGDRTQIIHNRIDGNGDTTQDGISLADGAVACLINDNYIHNMMGDGICLVANNIDCQISDNYISNVDDDGIHLIAGCDDNSIDGNYINVSGDDGIELTGTCDDNYIGGNSINSSTNDDIVIAAADCDNTIIENNQHIDTGGSAVADSGTGTVETDFDPAAPGAIGGTTPAAGTFTDLTTTVGQHFTALAAEPAEVVGGVYLADNEAAGWDPCAVAGTDDYFVVCTVVGAPGTFVALRKLDGTYLMSALDGVVIGGTTPAAGTFTTLIGQYASVLDKTANYAITTADFGMTIRMNNAAARILTFPSVGATEDGARVTVQCQGAGRLTLQMVDTDKIMDSAATATCFTDDDNIATLTLEYNHAITTWIAIGGHGTWVTT